MNMLGSFLLFVGQDQLGENYLACSHTCGSQNALGYLGKTYALHIHEVPAPPFK